MYGIIVWHRGHRVVPRSPPAGGGGGAFGFSNWGFPYSDGGAQGDNTGSSHRGSVRGPTGAGGVEGGGKGLDAAGETPGGTTGDTGGVGGVATGLGTGGCVPSIGIHPPLVGSAGTQPEFSGFFFLPNNALELLRDA